MKKYIIYLITNKLDDKIYIGCHVTKNINDDYMGSGSNIRKAIKEIGVKYFHKDILYIFMKKEDMLAKELELVNAEFIKRTDTYNIILGGMYNTSGTISVKDKEGNILQVHETDERYLSGELVFIWKDKKHKEETKKIIGIKNSVNQKGNNNSQYGTRWIHHEKIKENKRIKNEELDTWLNLGWKKGRKMIFSNNYTHKIGKDSPYYGTCWIYNDELKESKQIKKEDLDTWLNLGWVKGRKVKIINNYIIKNGKNSSQYGTCWIYNEQLKENKKIKKEDLDTWLDLGWIKGRKNIFINNYIIKNGKNSSHYGTYWIYNDELKESKQIKNEELDTWLNLGWIKGRKIKTNKHN